MTTHIWSRTLDVPQTPVVLSVPHAGRHYPLAMKGLARLTSRQLQSLEDRYSDALVSAALDDGHQVIICQTARAWIDLNRAEDEVDPGMFTEPRPEARVSAKVRGGLGLIPRRIAVGDIWRAGLTASDLSQRIDTIHRPYHDSVSAALSRAVSAHGVAVLIDVHSMPSLKTEDAPHIVIGNLFGRSAAPDMTDCAMAEIRAAGLRVALNAPYAGGHILERHSAPHRGIHALQIEIDRKLYLDADSDETGPGLGAMRQFVRRLASALAAHAGRRALPMAAE
jgi:N-formylglutamate amidohydrolase